MAYIGFDTSNYTTSAAFYLPEENIVIQKKRLLPVEEGKRGLRQSDTVFFHTKQMPEIMSALAAECGRRPSAAGCSVSPVLSDRSYMPCFLVGKNCASVLGCAMGIPVYETSHQHGHILAALFSSGRIDLINSPFFAFHVSGGTTDLISVTPDRNTVIRCERIGGSSDLKAGQAIDRIGVSLGLPFPSGARLDELAVRGDPGKRPRISHRDGECSFSGVENQCMKMAHDGVKTEDICAFLINYIKTALEISLDYAFSAYGDRPVVFCGGVMSNSVIRQCFKNKYNAYFASPELSSDNAAGIALYAYLKDTLYKDN